MQRFVILICISLILASCEAGRSDGGANSPEEAFEMFMKAIENNDEELLSKILIDDDYIHNPSEAKLPPGSIGFWAGEVAGLSLERIEIINDCWINGKDGERIELECAKLHFVNEKGIRAGSTAVMKLQGRWYLVDT